MATPAPPRDFAETLAEMGGPSSRDLNALSDDVERRDRAMRIEMHMADEDADDPRRLRRSGDASGVAAEPSAVTLAQLGRVDTSKFGDGRSAAPVVDHERDKIDDDLLGDLGLADFMLLAYTVSNIYQRHKARSRKAKLDDSEVVGHDETLLFIVVALYAAAVLTLALTLMGGGIVCRPLSIQLGKFAMGQSGLGVGGHFEYGMDFINRVCETQIKLETSQFWPVFTMVTFLLLFVGAGVNSEFIRRYNRYHAIARRQYHSPLIGKQPVRAVEKEPGRFERFYLKFMVAKFTSIIVLSVMLGGFWFSLLTRSDIESTTVGSTTTWSGGNLLTRMGAICDCNELTFEEPFDSQYRCHLMGEAQVHYLKYLVVFSSCLVILVSIYQTAMMMALHAGYKRWRKDFDHHMASRANDAVPDELNPEMRSMFKMTRGLVRLIMYYLKPTPPEGDLPGLISKAMFGLQPSPDEMANISTKMLTDFATPKETSEMLMHIMRGVLGEHIGNSDDVRGIVLATVTAWKDSSTQRYLKGIVDTINAIHLDGMDRRDRERDREERFSTPRSPAMGHGGRAWDEGTRTPTGR